MITSSISSHQLNSIQLNSHSSYIVQSFHKDLFQIHLTKLNAIDHIVSRNNDTLTVTRVNYSNIIKPKRFAYSHHSLILCK